MLATLGLERLERRLIQGTVRADEVAEFLEQADRAEVDTLARDGMSTALDSFHQRRAVRAGCQPRPVVRSRPNPQFHPTPHVDSL